MAARPDVKANRRGARSREVVLDAAERVMAEHGYEAATLAAIVDEAGIPISSVYHYFGSKDGILLAVMERGADRFFAALPAPPAKRAGTAQEHLDALVSTACAALDEHPGFLRLLVTLAVQPPAGDQPEVRAVISRLRSRALDLLRAHLEVALRLDPDSDEARRLARFGLAVFDGAFVGQQADGAPLSDVVYLLPRVTLALHRSMR
jgi:AcrR family transcriptional regulator